MSDNQEFRKVYTYKKRKEESGKIREKYPNKIPVIVEKCIGNHQLDNIVNKKYLVPGDLTLGEFIFIIRKRIKLKPEQAIFILINDIVPPPSSLMSELYEKYKDDDNFLYCLYYGESVFG